MDRIICLVGKSGSGKSTISELLEKQGYNYIESYTTRKQRFKGEKGHIFINTDNVPGYFDKKAFNNIEYNYEVNAEESIKKVLQSILNIIKKEDQKW